MLLYIFKDQNDNYLYIENLSGKTIEQTVLPPIGSLYVHSEFTGRIKDIIFNKKDILNHVSTVCGGNDNTIMAYIIVDTLKRR